jgi:hypothetical protein
MRIPAPRTLASALRTAVYGVVCTVFAVTEEQASLVVDSLLVGAVLADYVTWLTRSLFLLPTQLYHGAYELCLNVAVGMFLYHVADIRVNPSPDSVGLLFASFMLVLAVKLVVYSAQFLSEITSS